MSANPEQFNVGCGKRIAGIGRSLRCGEAGLCSLCWAIKHDEHPPKLRAERDHLRKQLDEVRELLIGIMGEPKAGALEVIIPAGRLFRWPEAQIAGMVGLEVSVGGERRRVTWSGPLDGDPFEGASAVVLMTEAISDGE